MEFYQHFCFTALPLDSFHLYLMTKDIHEYLWYRNRDDVCHCRIDESGKSLNAT